MGPFGNYDVDTDSYNSELEQYKKLGTIQDIKKSFFLGR